MAKITESAAPWSEEGYCRIGSARSFLATPVTGGAELLAPNDKGRIR